MNGIPEVVLEEHLGRGAECSCWEESFLEENMTKVWEERPVNGCHLSLSYAHLSKEETA